MLEVAKDFRSATKGFGVYFASCSACADAFLAPIRYSCLPRTITGAPSGIDMTLTDNAVGV